MNSSIALKSYVFFIVKSLSVILGLLLHFMYYQEKKNYALAFFVNRISNVTS